MKNLRSGIRVGDRVRVRRQRWQVADICPYGACSILTLRGAGAVNFAVTLRVIVPFEHVERSERLATLRVVGLRRWRRACLAHLAAHGGADALQTARRAHIDLLPHQLEPAIAVVRGLGSRVLIADEVGLGKTIQAGLIVSELKARGAADRVLILAPAGLREQWAAELSDRFELDAAVVDMSGARRRAAQLPVGTNPWATIPIAIASFDYVKRPEVLPAIASCRWDVVIVDEAHGVTAGSDRRRAIESICRRTPYVLLLTATPHNGDRTAFASLCDLGMLAGDRLVVFRRSRYALALGPGRRVHRLLIRPSSAERRMHEQLATFRQSVAADGNGINRDVWLALAVLHKRSLSSARSLEHSISRRLSILASGENDGLQQLALPLDEGGGEFDARDQPPPWTLGTLIDQSSERALLEPLVESARLAAAGETKLASLRRLLRRLQRLEESAIVFTEYRDTLAHVRHALRGDCAVLHGGLTRAERHAELDRFSTGRRTVLLATDAAGEGLNLHHRCRIVINLELPWNPTRLEQRIGRVDRIGQRRRVHVFHLIARDTGEIRIMDYLRERIATARADIATPDPLGNIESVDDEVAIARVIMGGESGGRGFSEADLERRRREAGSGSPTSAVLKPALTRDAALEHARLVQARSFSLASDETVASGIDRMAAFARRTTVRQQLGGRLLAVLQTILEDPYGRTVASRLVPVLVELSRPRGSRFGRFSMRRIAQELEARAPARTALENRAWQDVHRAFWATRRQREIDIAAIGDSRTRHDLVQAGLFDMRTLRARAGRTDVDAEEQAESARRIATASGRELQLAPARAVLLLFPPR